MTSKDVKKEILDGIFRSKDGLSSNELTELLNTLIEVARLEGKPASLDSLIERVEAEVPKLGTYEEKYENGMVRGLHIAIEILRTTPCIKAKALRKRGADEWYRFNYNGGYWYKDDIPETFSDSVTNIGFFNHDMELPADAELVDIQILIL